MNRLENVSTDLNGSFSFLFEQIV